MKKIVCLLLAGILLLSAVSCGTAPEDPSPDTSAPNVSDTSETSSTVTETEPVNVYEGIDLDGFRLRVLNHEGVIWCTPPLDFEELTGNKVNDEIFERNRYLEETIHFTLDVIESPTPIADFTAAAQASDDAYDAVYCRNTSTPAKASTVIRNIRGKAIRSTAFLRSEPGWPSLPPTPAIS